MKNIFLSLFLVLGVSTAHSFDIPALTRPVMDEVGVLNAGTVNQLENSLYALQQNQRIQLQVYIIKSLQGESIEGAAIKIFDKWKLGDAKTDKGLLFLIAPNEKRMRIEVGQGLEGDIPDVIAKRIISDVVKPYFQHGEMAAGIVQGVASLQNYLGAESIDLKNAQVDEAQPQQKSKKGSPWILIIVVVFWIILFIFNPTLALALLFSGGRGGRGGGGGGGWSGGGGSSSGGGASGSW